MYGPVAVRQNLKNFKSNRTTGVGINTKFSGTLKSGQAGPLLFFP